MANPFDAPYNIPEYFTPSLDYIAEQEGADPKYFNNLIRAESNYNPMAVSPAGAMGLGQLMPGTAKDLGVTNPFNDVENAFASARYFANMTDQFGSPELGAAAYNAGPGAVKKYGGIPPFAETQAYVPKVMGTSYDAMSNSARSNPYMGTPETTTATLPPGTGRRETDLSRITTEITSLEGMRDKTLSELKQAGSLEDNDAIAIALTAIIPTLLGMGFGGMKGGAIGAQAGAQGAMLGLQGMKGDMDRRNTVNQQIGNNLNQQIAARQAEAKGVRDSINDNIDKNQLAENQAQRQFTRDLRLDEMRAARDERLAKLKGEVGGSFTPEMITALSKLPEERTPQESQLVMGDAAARKYDIDQRKVLKDEFSAKTYRDQVDETKNKNEYMREGSSIVGAVGIPGAVRPIVPAEGKKLQAFQSDLHRTQSNLDAQKEILARSGASNFTGVDASTMRALQNEFRNIGRMLSGSGANLTKNELEFINALQAETLAGGSGIGAFTNWATGRDPVQAIEAIQKMLDKEMADKMITTGRAMPGAEYSDAQLARLGIPREKLTGLFPDSIKQGSGSGGLVDTGQRDSQGRRIMRAG